MTLGIALVVIFILYLIDKHNRWRQAIKIVGGLVALGAIAFGLFYAWATYSDYRTRKEIERAAARAAAAAPKDIFDEMASHPIWVHVDPYQEYGGAPVNPVKVPEQISEMRVKNQYCEPGSVTFGEDKIEWLCVRPVDQGNLPPGFIIDPPVTGAGPKH